MLQSRGVRGRHKVTSSRSKKVGDVGMKSCLLGVLCALGLDTAQAVVFDCVADQMLKSDGRDFGVVKVRQRTKYTVDTDSGMVGDGVKTKGYQVVQRGDPKLGQDWVLLNLPDGPGPYRSPEEVLRQVPVAGILRIRVWKDGNPFVHDWGGMLELGSCRPRR